MAHDDAERASRRQRGLILGGAGLVLLFGSAVSVIFLPGGIAPIAVVLMVVGIALLGAGYFAMPKKGVEPKA